MALKVRTAAARALTQAYSLWIFDRHCEAIFHQDWSHLHTESAAPSGGTSFTSSISSTLQRVGASSTEPRRDAAAVAKRARGDALEGVSGSVAAPDDADVDARLLPFDQEAKLIYGVVYSLRNMVRKLGGPYVALLTAGPSRSTAFRRLRIPCRTCRRRPCIP